MFLFSIGCTSAGMGQHTFSALVKDGHTHSPLPGATAVLAGTQTGGSADENGVITISDLPAGEHLIVFSFVGYHEERLSFQLPLAVGQPVEVLLEPDAHEIEEVVVRATRSSRTIADLPTRVEVISGEELAEKGNMKPGDIRMLLNESTGIQTQQTSATSYNSSIRIQGLDGKYTQILRDGLPLYAGFSGGLSLLQIVPLDLQQVEVVKGASSTLYGGGAIAGLVNLVSKTPGPERELSFMVNGTSALGLDASGFYAQRFNKVGATVFASYNTGSPYDPADIGFTAIPQFQRFTLNPRLFWYFSDHSTLELGINSTNEDRTGGSLDYIEGDAPGAYFERNKTSRLSTQARFDHRLGDKTTLSLKNSVSFYDRTIEVPDYTFAGSQVSSFSEANMTFGDADLEWIGGFNLWTDGFTQSEGASAEAVDYSHLTVGAFAQNTWQVNEAFTLETGLRGDYQDEYGFFALPRLSALVEVHEKLSARLGGGLGYKIPTVFTEDAERIQFRNVLPVDAAATVAEESIGGNFDINFRSPISEELFITVNTLFFYTRVSNPLVLSSAGGGFFEFQQPSGFIDTKGIETNVRLGYADFVLFVGHTLADVQEHYFGGTSPFPLVARHRLNNVLMYEVEEKLKIGLEAYYFSSQQLSDGGEGRPYWIMGLMTEKLWERFSIFLNFENFLDTRQSKFGPIYTGPVANPVFSEIYAPVDGFVVNGGFKLRL